MKSYEFTAYSFSLSAKNKIMTKSAIARKEASEAILTEKGIKFQADLPTLPEIGSVKLRPASLVAKRLIILDALIATTFEVEKEDAVVSLEDEVWQSLTSWEKKYFSNNEPPTEEEAIDLGWKIEAAKVLLWSTGLVAKMDEPNQEWDLEEDIEEIILKKYESLEDFISKATLIEKETILDYADLMFRTQANCDKDLSIAPYDEGIVYERNYALQWLIGALDWPI